MSRLRSQRRSSSERTTTVDSPDGPMEVRRRRKRRTNQPKKASKTESSPKLRRYALFIGVPLVMLGVGLYLLFQARYESDRFKEGVGQRATEILEAPTSFAQFEVKGLTVKNRRMLITPTPGSILRDADITSLTGRLAPGSMMSSDWNLESVSALHGTLNFQAPRSGGIVSAESGPADLQFAGFGLSKKPDFFNIDKLLVGSATFNWIPSKINKPIPFVYETSVTTSKIGATTDINLSGGRFQIPPRPDFIWPDFKIDSAKMRYTKGRVELEDSTLTHHTIGNMVGEAAVSGGISLDPRLPIADFTCRFFKMPAESLLHEEFKAHFSGDVDATLQFRANLAKRGSLEVTGDFSVTDGRIANVIPLKSLAALVAEPRMSDVEFHSIKAQYSLAKNVSTVDNIDALAPNLIHITGGYSIQDDGILAGRLRVGMPEKILAEIHGGCPTFFEETDPSNGMRYAQVTLGGTREEPVEDLTTRIEEAIEKHQIDSAAPPASSYPTIPRAPGTGDDNSKSKKKAEEAFDKLIAPE